MDINPANGKTDTLIAISPRGQTGEGSEALIDAKRILREFLRELPTDTKFQKIYRKKLAEKIVKVYYVKSEGNGGINFSGYLRNTCEYIYKKLKSKLATDSSPGGKYLNEFFTFYRVNNEPVCKIARKYIAYEGFNHIVSTVVDTVFDATELTIEKFKITSFKINITGDLCKKSAAKTMAFFKEHDPKIAEMNAKTSGSAHSRQAEGRHRGKHARAANPEKTMPPKVETKAVETKKAGVVETFRNWLRALKGIRK